MFSETPLDQIKKVSFAELSFVVFVIIELFESDYLSFMQPQYFNFRPASFNSL